MENQELTNQPPVAPPSMETKNYDSTSQVMSVKEWIISLVLMIIPFVNIVMLFIWAFGSSTNKNKSNWAKASLILMAIGLVLYIIIIALFGAAFLSMIGGGNSLGY